MLVRATTTTNAHGGRRQRLHIPTTHISNGIDTDYLQALKLIDRATHRQTEPTRKKLQRSNAIKQKHSSFQLTSKLTPIAQEAMVKTYEDTLVSHITNVYSSKRIGKVLPRLPTATYRERLPIVKPSHSHLDYIHEAQTIIDNILNQSSEKDELLWDYVRWQQTWTQNI